MNDTYHCTCVVDGAAVLAELGMPIDGTFTYKPPLGGAFWDKGTQTFKVNFVPNDQISYASASEKRTVEVMKTPEIVWDTDAQFFSEFEASPVCE